MTDNIIPQKRCTRCQNELPATFEFFSPNKRLKCGLNSHCKRCKAEMSNQYYHDRKDDPDFRAKQRKDSLDRLHRRNDLYPEKHEADKARGREREKTKRQEPDFNEKRRAKRNLKRENEVRAIRRSNDPNYREHVNKGTRERRAANPDYWRLKNRIYSAKRRSQMGTIHYTQADVTLQYNSQKERCWHCGKKLNGKYHIDHLIPLSRGGTDKASNIVISCPLCNERKHDKFTWEWNGRLL